MAKKIRKTSFDKRLKAYSELAKGAKDFESSKSKKLIGLALTAGMVCTVPQVADAAIIYSGPQNIFVSTGSTYGGFNWGGVTCVTAGGNSNLTMDIQDTLPGAGDGRLEFSYHSGDPMALGTTGSMYAMILSSGFVISSGASAGTTQFADYMQVPDNASGYIGFKFDGCVPVLYGWMQVSGNADGSAITIIDWAIEDSGAPILAGDTVGAPAVPVLTLNQWGLLILIALLAGAGVRMLRKQEEV